MTSGRHLTAAALLGVLALTGLPAAAHAADGPNVTADLTSTPFNASPGDKVTHQVVVRNTGSAGAADSTMRFTTTLPMTGVEAKSTQGTCRTVRPDQVECTLGSVQQAPAEPTVITISGTLDTKRPPGGLVRNTATVTTSTQETVPDDNTSINGYLIAAPPQAPVKAEASGGFSALGKVALFAAALLVLAGLFVLWNRSGRPSPAILLSRLRPATAPVQPGSRAARRQPEPRHPQEAQSPPAPATSPDSASSPDSMSSPDARQLIRPAAPAGKHRA
ncbi:DUF11 domain-containing protein [Longispora albida]|uniref:DUF11 domain-containing protein n=1 Tax=Longispora albida TaxID=203523 RepID=UPI00037B3C04|nr:DUF11 domain-containing protein [Longispora albida]